MIHTGKERVNRIGARVQGRAGDGKREARSTLDPKPQTPNPKPPGPYPLRLVKPSKLKLKTRERSFSF